jgi:Flp pilus assembly CpaE family ATPase
MWREKMQDGMAKDTQAGRNFLTVLKVLRTVILQDAVVLRQRHPNNSIFRHQLFHSDEFNAFADRSLEAIRNAVASAEMQIQLVMPFVNELSI